MFQHQDNKKLYHLTEIIPAERLKLASLNQGERFLIAKREKNRIILAGLGDYLREIKEQKEF